MTIRIGYTRLLGIAAALALLFSAAVTGTASADAPGPGEPQPIVSQVTCNQDGSWSVNVTWNHLVTGSDGVTQVIADETDVPNPATYSFTATDGTTQTVIEPGSPDGGNDIDTTTVSSNCAKPTPPPDPITTSTGYDCTTGSGVWTATESWTQSGAVIATDTKTGAPDASVTFTTTKTAVPVNQQSVTVTLKSPLPANCQEATPTPTPRAAPTPTPTPTPTPPAASSSTTASSSPATVTAPDSPTPGLPDSGHPAGLMAPSTGLVQFP